MKTKDTNFRSPLTTHLPSDSAAAASPCLCHGAEGSPGAGGFGGPGGARAHRGGETRGGWGVGENRRGVVFFVVLCGFSFGWGGLGVYLCACYLVCMLFIFACSS